MASAASSLPISAILSAVSRATRSFCRGGQRIIVDRGRSRRGDRGRLGLERGPAVGRPCVPGDLVGLDLLVERFDRRLRRAARLVDLVLERLARRRCIIGGALSAPAAAAAELHLSGLRLARGRQAAEIAIVKPFASPKDAGDCSMRVIGGVPGGVRCAFRRVSSFACSLAYKSSDGRFAPPVGFSESKSLRCWRSPSIPVGSPDFINDEKRSPKPPVLSRLVVSSGG